MNRGGIMQDRSAAAEDRRATRHPAVDDIRDLLTFRIAMLAAANDRMGHS